MTRRLIVLCWIAVLVGCSDEAMFTETRALADEGPTRPEWPVFRAVEPAPDTRMQPVVVREIAPLDENLTGKIHALVSEIENSPTTASNVRDRLPLIQSYYDALQGEGVLLNYAINSAINAISAHLAAGLPLSAAIRNRISTIDHALLELLETHRSIGRTGTLHVRAPSSPILEAKSYQTLVFEYEVGERPIHEGGRLRIGYNWYSDVGDIQFTRPHEAGYATVECSNPDVRLAVGPEYWFGQQFTSLFGAYTRSVSVVDGSLQPGDRLTLTIGDRSQGSPGWLVQSFTNDAMDFRLEADFDGRGRWVPVAQPRFVVEGSDPDHLRVIAPSVVNPGEGIRLRVNVEDRFFNEASRGPEKLAAYLDGELVAEAEPVVGFPGRFVFPDIDAPDVGEPLYFDVRSPDGSLTGVSNPVIVKPAGSHRLYWGELHGHEGYTDANGTPDWYMEYARNVAFLDFAALTGHDQMLSELHFRDTMRAARQYNDRAGGFITFPAYEWTAQWSRGGHHNVFHLDDQQRVLTSYETGTLSTMLAEQRRRNEPDRVLIIPHAHQPGDWSKMVEDLGPLVEIFSTHGSFEWFGRRFLDQGLRVGFNSASDDHIGHPGNAPARAQVRGGLAAVYSPELSREALFSALKQRRTYATTLARMYLDTKVAGAGMGEVIDGTGLDRVALSGLVAGTAPIASITANVNGRELLIADYANAQRNTGRLWFRVTSSSEPNNPDAPRTPRGGVRYLGMIDFAADEPAVLKRMQGIGIEPYGDAQAQISAERAAFSWRVRGDYDAMLLDLDSTATLESVRVRIWSLPMSTYENWNIRDEPRLPGQFVWHSTEVPGGTLLVDRTVMLTELLDGRLTGEIEAENQWELSFVHQDLPRHRRFEGALGPEHGLTGDGSDYVYVRARQLDDHTAWSSPTFLE